MGKSASACRSLHTVQHSECGEEPHGTGRCGLHHQLLSSPRWIFLPAAFWEGTRQASGTGLPAISIAKAGPTRRPCPPLENVSPPFPGWSLVPLCPASDIRVADWVRADEEHPGILVLERVGWATLLAVLSQFLGDRTSDGKSRVKMWTL